MLILGGSIPAALSDAIRVLSPPLEAGIVFADGCEDGICGSLKDIRGLDGVGGAC